MCYVARSLLWKRGEKSQRPFPRSKANLHNREKHSEAAAVLLITPVPSSQFLLWNLSSSDVLANKIHRRTTSFTGQIRPAASGN